MKKNIFFILVVLSSLQPAAQNVGIGINTPRAPLHVFAGNSGNTTPFSPVVVEGGHNTYINFLVPDIRESGILFGTTSYAASGGIIYNNLDPFPGTQNGFQFRTNGNITRMVLTQDGRLGIGIPQPSEMLEVNGSIKAASFKYATPKTFVHNIPGSAFRTEDSRDTSFASLGGGSASLYSILPGKRLIAPVQLPHGAVLQNMTVYMSDNAAADMQVVFYRRTITSNFFPDNIGNLSSSGNSGVITPYTVPVNWLSNVVDNTLYTYYISVGSTTHWAGSNMAVHAVVIDYTLSER